MSHRKFPILVALGAIVVVCGCSKEEPRPVPSQPPAATQAPTQPPPSQPAPPVTQSTPAASATSTPAAPAASATGVDPGAQVFATYCQTCHGASGHGDGPAAVALNPKPASFVDGAFKYDANGNGTPGDIEDIQAVVRDGAAKYGGSPLMTPWSMLSAEQQQAVSKYVKSFSGG